MKTRGWRVTADRILAVFLSVLVVMSICPARARADEDVFDPNRFPPVVAQAGNLTMRRLYGDQRYQTMSSIVGEAFTSSNWAIVTTGEDFPDALCASALAGARRAPVIITPKGSLSTWASGQLDRLGVNEVLLVGNTGSVNETVEKEIRRLGINVVRIAGGDRYAMSVAVMREVRDAGSKSDAVIIATGNDYADALSIGPWAYATATPIVLTKGDGVLTDGAVKAIKADSNVKRVIIVGGHSVVDDSVILQLGAGYDYTRLGGPDRYETSMGVAQWETTQGFGWNTAAIATGVYYPDAITGAALLGQNLGPILLVHDKSDPTVSLLTEKASQVNTCYVLGGLISVPDALANPNLYLGIAEPTPAVASLPVVQPQPDTQQTTETTQTTDNSGQQTVDGRWYNTPVDNTTQTTSDNSSSSSSSSIGVNDYGEQIPGRDVPANYILNKNVNRDVGKQVFHLHSCGHLPDEKNRIYLENVTYNELVKSYHPCQFCTKPNQSY